MAPLILALMLLVAPVAQAQTDATVQVDPSEQTRSVTKVKDYLTKAGYTDIEIKDDAVREQEHVWSGSATKGDKRVQVHVSENGEISED